MRGKVKQDGSTLCRCRITPAYAGKRLRRQAPRCQSEDHPRLCGEKRMYTLLDLLPWGSPPPMRGKANGNKFIDGKYRITPAYAGKSVLGDPRCHSSRDHPRLCGEKFSIRSTKSNCPGSPPPMRGKVKYHGKGLYLHRITPAYAGKSYSTLGFQPFVRITPAYAGKRDSVKL